MLIMHTSMTLCVYLCLACSHIFSIMPTFYPYSDCFNPNIYNWDPLSTTTTTPCPP